MSIRLKLLFSYAAMLVVPLVLIVLTALLLVFVFRGDLQNLRSFYETQIEGIDDHDYHQLINHTIARNPALVTDPGFLTTLSDEMKTGDQFVIVLIDGNPYFVSKAIQTRTQLISRLPAFHHSGYRHEWSTKSYGNEFFSLSQYDFVPKSGQSGSLYVVTQVQPLVYFSRKYLPILLTSFLVILILTNSLLTYFMSKSIIRPLRKLHKATRKIKEGDLEFQVGVGGKDEIGQLGVAFEEMRSQLEKSIRLQLQYEENRKELVSNISHDLRTPITAIRGYVDGILDGVADSPDKIEKYVRTISAKAAEMDRLIEQLFLYSKLDLKRQPFSFEPIPIAAFLADWADELEFELEKMRIRLETEIRLEASAQVLADRDQFRRVLSNVIQNSVNYMDKEDKRIQLFASSDGHHVRIQIEDNGPGIEREALRYVFDRFYRAEQSRSADTGGSGLGLAIAKQIMEEHGGEIRAESEYGQGTRILLLLPVRKEGDRA
ncbi:HAMP domain-containing histidine kinase [Cohnella pontilimi]|uniref:histidine kinase n=1 Tax=Cohnella pontilimi TaxID=2564100 RepID=A0A4U0FGM0_9BACL|nr:HAMP domain-containing sensor histidine kinase [Cohnella pontilimi]TJY44071.1 HAMP domain-containing histidine kinase [Cohnella pontilimi]